MESLQWVVVSPVARQSGAASLSGGEQADSHSLDLLFVLDNKHGREGSVQKGIIRLFWCTTEKRDVLSVDAKFYKTVTVSDRPGCCSLQENSKYWSFFWLLYH